MQVIENLKVKEKLYIDKLENGLTVMIIPKKEQKKNILFGEQIMGQMIASLQFRRQKLQKCQKVQHTFQNTNCLNKKMEQIVAMYHNNPKIDITGTIETINHIDKEIYINVILHL